MTVRQLLFALVLAVLTGAPAVASTVYLSDYLGVPSGGLTVTGNAPYVSVAQAPIPYQFGVDRPGNFATNPIEFVDAGPFARGIGAHPNAGSPPVRLDFDLVAFRSEGFDFDTFITRVGIDAPSGGILGAAFDVYLDGTLVRSVTVSSVNAPSILLEIPLGAAGVLGLATRRVGGDSGNHAAFADARLTVVPAPPAAGLLLTGLAGLAARRRRRPPT